MKESLGDSSFDIAGSLGSSDHSTSMSCEALGKAESKRRASNFKLQQQQQQQAATELPTSPLTCFLGKPIGGFRNNLKRAACRHSRTGSPLKRDPEFLSDHKPQPISASADINGNSTIILNTRVVCSSKTVFDAGYPIFHPPSSPSVTTSHTISTHPPVRSYPPSSTVLPRFGTGTRLRARNISTDRPSTTQRRCPQPFPRIFGRLLIQHQYCHQASGALELQVVIEPSDQES